jgi:hypothetical protein
MLTIFDVLLPYWQWLVGGILASILGGVQLRLYLHQTRESRLKIQELESKLRQQVSHETAPPREISVRSSFLGYSYREIVEHSSDLIVVVNDGRSFIDTNRELFRDRLASKAKSTRICFVHPKSPYLELLLRKNGKIWEVQIEEIGRSLGVLSENCPPGAHLEIKGHMRPSPYSLVLTEDLALVTPYLFFEAGSLPMLIVSRGTELYEQYRNDALWLLKEGELLNGNSFPETKPLTRSQKKERILSMTNTLLILEDSTRRNYEAMKADPEGSFNYDGGEHKYRDEYNEGLRRIEEMRTAIVREAVGGNDGQ